MALIEDDRIYALSEATPGDYFALLKPRVMSLVVFTAFVGLVAAPVSVNPFVAVVSVLAIAIGAGASGALNMWYDADIDAVMSRTASRPIPSGRVRPGEALGFGLVLSALSVMTLGLVANWLAAAFLAFTIFFYAVVYTMWLKRWTPQNIVIGGAAGAFPPMIGWAAAANGFGVESFLLFLVIFLWTPPHFWALALFKAEEYGRAGIPMMPNVAGEASTRRQIFLYSLLIAPVGVAPWLLGYVGFFYGLVSVALGAGFLWYAWKVLRMAPGDRAMRPAKALFGYSLLIAPVGVAPWLLGYVGFFYGLVSVALGAGFLWYAWKVLGMAPGDRAMRPAKALFGYSLLYLFAIFAAYLADVLISRGMGVAGA